MKTRITNGLIKAINGLLQLAKRLARGFRSFKNFRIMAYLKAANLKLAIPPLSPTQNSEEAKNMISLCFNVGRDDMMAFTQAFHNNSPTVRATLRRAQLIFPIIMFVGATYFYFRQREMFSFSLLFLGGIWAAVYPAFFRWHIVKTTEKLLKEASHEKAFGAYYVTFDDEGISSKSPTGEARYRWEAVDRVLMTSDHLHIFLAGPMGYPIPRGEIEEETIQKVKSFAESKIRK